MCTEIILATIYFMILFIVNFLLGKFLITYFKNIFSLLKLKTIFTKYKTENLFFISNLYMFLEKDEKYLSQLNSKKFLLNEEDPFLVGNLYKTLLQNKKVDTSIRYYFELLRNQYIQETS
jgi:hypothetical protein